MTPAKAPSRSRVAFLGCRAKHKTTGEWWWQHWDDDKSPCCRTILMEEGSHNGFTDHITVEFLQGLAERLKESMYFCDPATFEIVRVLRTIEYTEPEKVG